MATLSTIYTSDLLSYKAHTGKVRYRSAVKKKKKHILMGSPVWLEKKKTLNHERAHDDRVKVISALQ